MDKEELNKLNESIKHCEDVISNLKLKENCDECLKQHEQLKKWLIEYKNLINPQPYKLEDLKEGMWVFDEIKNTFIKIAKIVKKTIYVADEICELDCYGYFEEERFFPATKALQYQLKEVKYDE